MHELCVKYLKDAGIDFGQRGHPFSDLYLDLKTLNEPFPLKSFENITMQLVIALEEIRKFNNLHHSEYIKKLSAKDTSFWGVKYEIQWYYILIKKFKEKRITAIRRGISGLEPDFIINYHRNDIGIETTCLTYDLNSSMSDPISKIKQAIFKKGEKQYASESCCLIIDISNLIFYRKIYSNFSITISELTDLINSNFGAVLLFQSVHIKGDNGDPRYVNQFYNWINPKISHSLEVFIKDVFDGPKEDFSEKLRFPVG